MSRKSGIVLALVATIMLMAACKESAVSKQTTLVKANQTQTAFFDRPVALAAARASQTPYPLIVMLTSNPWLMVIGSDSPTFALYSDGTVIFQTKAGFKSAKLDQKQKANLVRTFENPDLAALAGSYDASDFTDQPESALLVYGNKVPFYISVYGSLDDKSVRMKVPTVVTESLDKLRNFQASNSRAWLPNKIEVMLWPYEYALDQSIVWPQRWPNLEDPTTRKRGDSYSIYIASAELPALKSFLATKKEKGAVEIEGKKFAASIRLPFPHESLWMAQATR
jgi:hypothetical protein